MTNCLEVEHLYKSFPLFSLEDVNFVLPEGAIMGFVGENGAGKTTTIKLILDLLKKDSGAIRIFGNESVDISTKSEIGAVLSDGFFPDNMNPAQIAKVMHCIYHNFDQHRFERYCSDFQLPMKKNVKDFSTGMKMKCKLATALAHNPKLLILDEPTSGLDPIVRNEILDIFLDYIQDESKSILFSSHITDDLEKIADYITFIHSGRIVFSDSKDEIMDHYKILKCGRGNLPDAYRSQVLFKKENQFGCEYLIKNRQQVSTMENIPVVDPASLDDIMLFYAKGARV